MSNGRTLAATGGPMGEPPSAAQAASELAVGAAVGRYIVLGRLGAGAMGVVYAAHDQELDRKVALKMLLPGSDENTSTVGGRSRLLREAQALAKLAHPNVVAVYDVGTLGDRVWMAMELVAGTTVARWARERPRSWSEVLRVLIDVARGVAAAHAAGLVHRDLKPENVMIGADDRVRVMDFGLAHGRTAANPSVVARDVLESALSLQLTRPGTLQGSPAYMAPEQWHGHEVGPAADQFAWCVMAWELLYDQRPFAGDTLMTLAASVMAGRRRRPVRGRKVPGWLRRVIERGLADEPAQRWPSMQALLAELVRGRTRARLKSAGVAVAIALFATGGAWAWHRADVARRVSACEAEGAGLDAVWNDAARKRVRAALVATGVSYAATTSDKLMPLLDSQATAWKEARTGACLDAQVREQTSADTLDRSRWCLDERRMQLEALIGELAQADARVVQRAIPAAAGLSQIAACRDPLHLARLPGPPPEQRAAVGVARAELSRALSLELLGKYTEALAVAQTTMSRVEALAWPRMRVTAQLNVGRLLEKAGQYQAAERALEDAYFAAAKLGAEELAATASSELVFVVGIRQARHAEALRWARHADVAFSTLGPEAKPREATHLSNVATVLRAMGKPVDAMRLLEQALAIAETSLDPRHPNVAIALNNLASVHYDRGDYAEAKRMHTRALSIREEAYGPDHPVVSISLGNLALVDHDIGNYAEAERLYRRALAIDELALGPAHPDLAYTLDNLANTLAAMGDTAAALRLHQRAVAIDEQTHGPDSPDVAHSLGNLANVHAKLGEYAEARRIHERVLAIRERAFGGAHPSVALSCHNLAEAHAALGDHAAAIRLYTRALAIWEVNPGPDHPNLAHPLIGLARVALAEQRPAEALALAERALTLRETSSSPAEDLAEARFVVARALWAATQDRARATSLAEQARDGFRASGDQHRKEFAEVEQWLSERSAGG